MRYAPTPSELALLDEMDSDERMHFFITRVMESEEVWFLADRDGGVMRPCNGTTALPLWPYRMLAEAAAGPGESADSMSLEHFVYEELNALHAEGTAIELFPGRAAGMLMSASSLYRILEGKLDEQEYFIEG